MSVKENFQDDGLVWMTAKNEALFVHEMDTTHLANALHWCEKRPPASRKDGIPMMQWIDALSEELRRRVRDARRD